MFKNFLINCLHKDIKKRYDIYQAKNDPWLKGYQLLLDEKDPQLHPIQKEIQRLNEFRQKLVNSDKNDIEDNYDVAKNKNNKSNKKRDNFYYQMRKNK